jgi:hypothetical protein
MSMYEAKLILGSEFFDKCLTIPLFTLNQLCNEAWMGDCEKELSAMEYILAHRSEWDNASIEVRGKK